MNAAVAAHIADDMAAAVGGCDPASSAAVAALAAADVVAAVVATVAGLAVAAGCHSQETDT